ncbi:metallophosphoesterase family protein [Flavilitoribacter nigricans]|nr:metallophosphoesterase family protein [Flavilitoribacter nigricans]
MRQIAITDIHGCHKTFRALLDKVALSREDELFLLGDYIDRGPDSKGVIDTILKLKADGYQLTCLLGNHEQMFFELSLSPPGRPLYLYPGLAETLASYNCRHPKDIPPEHLEFILSLPSCHRVEDYWLVHAGFNFSIPDPLEDQHAMIWERHWYESVNKEWVGRRIILHGHTPTRVDEILSMYEKMDDMSALILDSGCVFRVQGLNQLTAFDMTNRRLYFQQNIDL